MKRIIVTLLAIAMLLSTCAFAEGQFRVGMECDYPPFNWTQVDENENTVPIDGGMGYAGGYDVEIAKKVAEGLGKELVIVKVEWDGLIQKLNAGQIDAVIAGMSPTAERKITVDFTDAYYNSDLVIVVRKDSDYANAATLEDFRGLRELTLVRSGDKLDWSALAGLPALRTVTADASMEPVLREALAKSPNLTELIVVE